MKRFIQTAIIALFAINLLAQSPEKLSYQAVIRNASDNLVTSKQVGIRISIVQGSADGDIIYSETHSPTTNVNGLVSIEIGTGTTSDDFSAIEWANGTYFIKTETDIDGGVNYTITGTSQLLSVPYALHAKTASYVTEPLNETDPLFGSSAASSINEENIDDWNNKQNNLSAGAGISIIEDVISVLGTPQAEMNYFPQSADKGSYVLVSFSGADVNFSQASPIALQFEQASAIYPIQVRHINTRKVDVMFDIPWNAATGTYNIIVNPNEDEPTILENAFLIDWFWEY